MWQLSGACKAGSYFDTVSNTCEACPGGYRCDIGTTNATKFATACPAGFVCDEGSGMKKCPAGLVCGPGSTTATATMCPEGYTCGEGTTPEIQYTQPCADKYTCSAGTSPFPEGNAVYPAFTCPQKAILNPHARGTCHCQRGTFLIEQKFWALLPPSFVQPGDVDSSEAGTFNLEGDLWYGCVSCSEARDCSLDGTTRWNSSPNPGYFAVDSKNIELVKCFFESACGGSSAKAK